LNLENVTERGDLRLLLKLLGSRRTPEWSAQLAIKVRIAYRHFLSFRCSDFLIVDDSANQTEGPLLTTILPQTWGGVSKFATAGSLRWMLGGKLLRREMLALGDRGLYGRLRRDEARGLAECAFLGESAVSNERVSFFCFFFFWFY